MMVRLSNGTRLALPDDIDGEMLAASKPTSWLSMPSHFVFHLARHLGP